MLRFINALFWEFVQNLPAILFLIVALWLWTHHRRWQAALCIISGAVIVALTIRYTEPLTTGYHESWRMTLVNMAVLALLEPPFVVYLGGRARWSSWKTDLLLGGLAGVGFALAQGAVASGAPLIGIVLHSVALGVAGGLVLVGVRMTRDKPLRTALAQAVLIVAFMTLIIGIIDYAYLMVV